jgi:outer membrane protein OmpA-like peptidoglycan-associated protein
MSLPVKPHVIVGSAVGVAAVLAVSLLVQSEVRAAAYRLDHPDVIQPPAAIADHAEADYCTPEFKQVLQRVLNACGLVGSGSRRGCKPTDVKSLASISDEDFNALFKPLAKRGAIVMFDEASDKLDADAKKLIDERWLDRMGARYFFIVARGSQTGSVEKNRAISHKRANSVFFYLSETTQDPNLEKQVGMLWLGKEFAQLPKEFCEWKTSRQSDKCDEQAINRSAFISWVDCRL